MYCVLSLYFHFKGMHNYQMSFLQNELSYYFIELTCCYLSYKNIKTLKCITSTQHFVLFYLSRFAVYCKSVSVCHTYQTALVSTRPCVSNTSVCPRETSVRSLTSGSMALEKVCVTRLEPWIQSQRA